MEIIINNRNINLKIIRKNNKNLCMRFLDSHTLMITCPARISEKEIVKLIPKNEKTLVRMLNQKVKEEQKDEYFNYLGKNYQKILDGITSPPKFSDTTIQAKDEKILEKFYKKECERVFHMEVERIVPYFPNIPSFTLKIRTMKTRWGVNNRGNNTITLNSELLKKDLDLLDYVIIHELCHFYEPNHSDRFWRHVEEYYPKYKDARKRLRG